MGLDPVVHAELQEAANVAWLKFEQQILAKIDFGEEALRKLVKNSFIAGFAQGSDWSFSDSGMAWAERADAAG